MKILALIPARGGSKRLPNKNLKDLDGKPLITWTIEAVQGIPQICYILISTDDPKIAKYAKDSGLDVPWLRPPELASDVASSVDVAIHGLDWFENKFGAVDGLLLLQPTSPFRKRTTIQEGIELFIQSNGKTVLSVSPSASHPEWMLKKSLGYLVPYLPATVWDTDSQNLPELYLPNGAFYLISPHVLRMRQSFLGSQTLPLLITDPQESLDIDTEWDFTIAELIAKRLI